MDTILQTPQWPQALSDFVTWCLMWDPKNRPNSYQAMHHEYFADAVDPLMRPKSGRLLGRRQQTAPEPRVSKEATEAPALAKQRSSWFRKSFVAHDSTPAVPQPSNPQLASPRPSPVHHSNSHPIDPRPISPKVRPNANKRTTWTNGPTSLQAPMPILPSIRPISPLSNQVIAEARSTNRADADPRQQVPDMPTPEKKKLGRQLSVASNGNHYGDREGGMNGGGLTSPTNGQKESFFSHLRKRARRFSGRNHLVASPKYDDVEANHHHPGMMNATNRSSMVVDHPGPVEPTPRNDFTELDRALQNVRYSLDTSSQPHLPLQHSAHPPMPSMPAQHLPPVRQHAPSVAPPPRGGGDEFLATPGLARSSSNARRGVQLSAHTSFRYETPDEEDELLDEALHGTVRAAHRYDDVPGGRKKRATATTGLESHRHALAIKDLNRASMPQPPALHHALSTGVMHSNAAAFAANHHHHQPYPNPYPTPSPSAKRNGVLYSNALLDEPATPIAINRPRKQESNHNPAWPTPPYEENEWAASAATQIFAAGSVYR